MKADKANTPPTTEEGLRLSRAFWKIRSFETREKLIEAAEKAVRDEGSEDRR